MAAALILLVAGTVMAGELPRDDAQPIRISADRLEYDVLRGLFVAEGSVTVRQGSRKLSADWVAFSERTGRGVASGHVVLVDGADTLSSSFVELDVYSFRGVVFDGRYESEDTGFRAQGAEIAKTGADTYRFVEGHFTTCRCPDEGRIPWSIRAREAELEIEGYGTARDTTFEVLGVPVVWLPWMLYPVKTQRQSGLLLPEFNLSGRNGVDIGLPIFWAAADNLNVTATPRWLSKRGPKVDAEIEFVLGRESQGDAFGSFIHDEKIKANTPREPFDKERWVAKGQNDLFLPLASRFKADFQFVSDNQYPTDFDGLGKARTLRYLESTGFLTRGFGRSGAYGLVGSAEYADDLGEPDDSDRDDILLQRLPHLQLAALPAPLPWLSRLVPTLGVQYTFFDQHNSARKEYPKAFVFGKNLFLDTGIDGLPDDQERGPDGGDKGVCLFPCLQDDPNADNVDTIGTKRGTERDGFFQEGEPLADHGHRAQFTPRLGIPLRLLDLLELYPEVGWHQTLYGSETQNFEQRGLLTGRADLRTRLRRRFGALVHVLEPRVGWAFVSDESQSSKPLYVPRTAAPQRRLRQLDLENVVLDPADRISEFNGVTWGFGNRIYGAAREGAPRLLADFRVSAAYEISDSHFGALYLDGRAYPWKSGGTWFSLGFDPEKQRLDEALLSLLWRFDRGHRIGFGYRYLRRVGRFFEDFRYARKRFKDFEGEFNRVNQVAGSGRLVLTDRWALSYRGGFSFEEAIVLANAGGVEYTSGCGCWSLGVEVAQDRVRGVQIGFSYSLMGLGREGGSRTAAQRGVGGFLDAF